MLDKIKKGAQNSIEASKKSAEASIEAGLKAKDQSIKLGKAKKCSNKNYTLHPMSMCKTNKVAYTKNIEAFLKDLKQFKY